MAYDSWGVSWGPAWGVSWVHGTSRVVVDTHDGADERKRRDTRKLSDKQELRRQLESFFYKAPPEYVAEIAQEAKGYIDAEAVDWEPLLADMGTVTRLLDLRDDWMDEEDFIILH